MTLEKLNILANIYRKERTNETFRAVYDALADARKVNRSLVMKDRTGDEAAAAEIFHDVLMRVLGTDVEFGRFFHRCLKNARTDFFRGRNREMLWQQSLDEILDAYDFEETEAIPKTLRSNYLEEDVFKKREADHRQVIDSLMVGITDTTTTGIVEAMMHAPTSATRNEIARSLGLHHEVIKRKLTALSRNYNEKRFGDYRDYLAV